MSNTSMLFNIVVNRRYKEIAGKSFLLVPLNFHLLFCLKLGVAYSNNNPENKEIIIIIRDTQARAVVGNSEWTRSWEDP